LHFECRLDTGTWTACDAAGPTPESHQVVYNTLAESEHTFAVRAKDVGGNLDGTPASRNWKVDLTKPVLTAMFTEVGPGQGPQNSGYGPHHPADSRSSLVSSGPYVPGTWADHMVRLEVTCSDGGASPTGVARNRVERSLIFGDGVHNVGALGAAPRDCVDRAGNVADPIGPWVVKVDTRAPSCQVTPQVTHLNPTGAMATVNLTLSASDNLSAAYALSTATMLPTTGDNGTVPADIGPASLSPAGAVTAQLKAIVNGQRSTRTYTLSFRVADEAGNSKTCTAKVVVR
jgi:hypothetical protein